MGDREPTKVDEKRWRDSAGVYRDRQTNRRLYGGNPASLEPTDIEKERAKAEQASLKGE